MKSNALVTNKPTQVSLFAKFLPLSLGLAVAAFAIQSAHAVNWQGDVVGDEHSWATAGNWDNNAVPGSGSVLFVATTTAANYPIVSTGSQACSELWHGAFNGNPSQLDITGGSLSVGSYFAVGPDAGSAATVNHSSGTVSVGGSGAFFIAQNGGTATYNLSGDAALTLSKTFNLGLNSTSTGNFNMSGGTLTVNSSVNMGGGGGSGDGTPTATFTMSGGTFSSTSWFSIGESGAGAVGTLNLAGGTINAATSGGTAVNLGDRDAASGTLNVSGGTFNSTGGGINVGNHWTGSGANTGTLTITNTGVVNTGPSSGNGIRIGAGAAATGTVNLNGGTLQTHRVQKGSGTGTFNFNGGTLKATAANTTFMTGLTAANVRDGGAVIDTAGFNVTIAQGLQHSAIGGDNATDGGLTKQGAGTLTLSGANSYNGATTVRNGTLALASGATLSSASGAVNVTAADGNANLSGSGTINGLVTLSASGSFTAGVNLQNSAATDTLTLAGGLTLNTGNALTFEVGTTADKIAITGGSYTAPASPALVNIANLPSLAVGTHKLITGASGISLGSFTLNSTPPTGINYALQVTGNDLELVVSVTVPLAAYWKGGVNGTWNAADSGGFFNWATDSGGATSTGAKPGAPTDLTFSASGAANESTTLGENFQVKSVTFTSAGNVTIGGGNTLQVDNGITVNSGAGANTISASGLILGSSQPVANNSANALTISSAISGSGVALTIGGTGTTIVSGGSTYDGGTVVSSGTLQLGAAGAIPDGAGKGNVTVDGTLDLNTFSETINGLSGSGTVDTIAGGAVTLTLGADDQTGSFSGNLQNTAGTLSVVKIGTGTQALSGAGSTYSGGTTINAGSLLAGDASALGSGPLALAGGTFGTTAALTIANNISVSGVSTIGQSTAQAITLSGTLTGNGTLKNFVGTAADENVFFTGNLSGFTGTLDYTGQQNNTTEWWRVGSGDATPTTVDLSGASVILRIGNVTSPNAFNKNFGFRDDTQNNTLKIGALSGDGVFQDAWAGGANALEVGFLNTDTTFSGILGGGNVASAMSFTKQGTGTLTLSGANRLTGAVVLNAGTLYATMANAANNRVFSLASSITVNTNTTLMASANSLFGWDGTQAKPITVNAGGTAISTNGDVNVGLITLAGGTLASGNPDPFWGSWNFGRGASKKLHTTESSVVTAEVVGFHNGATIEVDSGKTLNFLGTIGAESDGGSAVIKTGAGTLTLAGANTYTGVTTVSNGTLIVNGSISNGAVTVVTGATLNGNGTIGGATTVNGALAPSGTFPATLTVDNTLTLAGAASFRINATQNDKVAGVTTFTSGGALNVTLDSGSLTGGETFTLVQATTYGGTAPTAGTLPALGSGLNWYLGNLPVDGSITVNRAPTASAITMGVSQGDSATVTIIGGKYAPADADGNALEITAVGSTSLSGSSVVIAGGGTGVTYTAPSDASGSDSFDYTVSDGRGGTVMATVTVMVSPASTGANMAPASLSVNAGVATMQALGIPGAYYHLQYTESLSPVNWQDVTDGDVQANPSNGTLSLTDSGASGPMRYYRTRYVSGP